VDGVVLAVHGQDGDAGAAGGLRHETAGHHQHFLVRERDGLAGADGREHRLERGRAGRRAQHDVRVGVRGDRDQALAAVQHARRRPGPEPRAKIRPRLGRSRRDDVGTVRGDLLRQPGDVLARRERDDAQPIRVRADDRQRTAPDRPGRSEDRDPLHARCLRNR
jgi:hypothetical protein